MQLFDDFAFLEIDNERSFIEAAIEQYEIHSENNPVYREFLKHTGFYGRKVMSLNDIPFLPIRFFKSHKVIVDRFTAATFFSSSGTTGSITSKHHVAHIDLYEQVFHRAFELFYGNPRHYCILALLPSYLERSGSSLVHMVDGLIRDSKHPQSGFYLNELDKLATTLKDFEAKKQKVLLIGVSFALLDLAEKHAMPLKNTIVMETGGMKGRRKEMIRSELHAALKNAFCSEQIHSEYGMTELLSQAYSKGDGVFDCPPWMKILIRDSDDPFGNRLPGKTGGINVIDLANRYSCPFIATEDLGRSYADGRFEVLGRFDHSDVRGCNLLAL